MQILITQWQVILLSIILVLGLVYILRKELSFTQERHPFTVRQILFLLRENHFEMDSCVVYPYETNIKGYTFVAIPDHDNLKLNYSLEEIDGRKVESVTFSEEDHLPTRLEYRDGIFTIIEPDADFSVAFAPNIHTKEILKRVRSIVAHRSNHNL